MMNRRSCPFPSSWSRLPDLCIFVEGPGSDRSANRVEVGRGGCWLGRVCLWFIGSGEHGVRVNGDGGVCDVVPYLRRDTFPGRDERVYGTNPSGLSQSLVARDATVELIWACQVGVVVVIIKSDSVVEKGFVWKAVHLDGVGMENGTRNVSAKWSWECISVESEIDCWVIVDVGVSPGI